jgi:hypothetical protein
MLSLPRDVSCKKIFSDRKWRDPVNFLSIYALKLNYFMFSVVYIQD